MLRIACIIFVGLFIQLQFGCSLVKSGVSGDGNSAASRSSENTNGGGNNQEALSKTPAACRNAYYPVGEDTTRKYRIVFAANVPPPSEHTEKFADFTANSFVVKNDFNNVSTSINWQCTPDGLLGTQYNNSVDIKNGGSSVVETLSAAGVSVPVESRWKVGEKWSTNYKIKETMKTPAGQKSGDAEGNVAQDYEIVGTEDVTVAAGAFQTFKVKLKTVLNLTVKVGGASVPVKVPVDSTIWFARDVGVVKTENKSDLTGTATTELLSCSGTK